MIFCARATRPSLSVWLAGLSGSSGAASDQADKTNQIDEIDQMNQPSLDARNRGSTRLPLKMEQGLGKGWEVHNDPVFFPAYVTSSPNTSMLRRYVVRRKEARLVQGATVGHRSRSVTSCHTQTKTAAPLLEPPSVMTRYESRLRCVFPPPGGEAQETCTEQEQGRGFGQGRGWWFGFRTNPLNPEDLCTKAIIRVPKRVAFVRKQG